MNKYLMLSALLLSLNGIKADDRSCCTSECPSPEFAPSDRTSETPCPAPLCGQDIIRMSPQIEGIQVCFNCQMNNCCEETRGEITKNVAKCIDKCQQPNCTVKEQNKAIDTMIRDCRKIAEKNEGAENNVTIQTSITIIAPEQVADESAAAEETSAQVEAGE